MPNKANRAAQFAPFDALKGLQDELRRREYKHSREPKRDLSEERLQNISNELVKVSKGSIVDITYYYDEHYFSIQGIVDKINIPFKFLMINDLKITFDDIYELKTLRQ